MLLNMYAEIMINTGTKEKNTMFQLSYTAS